MAPPAPDRRLGPTRRVPEYALRIAVPDGRMAAGLQLERVRGWSSTWARRRLLGPQTRGSLGWADGVRIVPGRRSAALGPKGAPTGSEVDYTQCASSCWSGARRPQGLPPRGGHLLLLQPSFLVAAVTETPEAGLAPARAGLSVTLSSVDIRVARALNAARGGGSRERDTGRRPGSGLDLLRPDLEAVREVPEPGKRGLGGQPVTHSAEPPGQLQAPPVRRAVSTAAVRIGSRLMAKRSPDRGNGGPAVSWTSQPGRPATRDFHHPNGSRPQRAAAAAQPA